MKTETWLKATIKKLEKAGIGTARLDCLVLLEDVTGKGRAHLLAHPELELTAEQLQKLDSFIKRRAEHEPLAYLRHKTEFYGREFYIDHRVLEPRPESEAIIELLKNIAMPAGMAVADIGTGSGMLAITTKLELPAVRVVATDVDENCLAVAQQNAATYKADINFVQGDLLEPLASSDEHITALLCNLPYVPDNFQINPAAMAEPHVAIFGGPDGLDLYRKLFNQAQRLKFSPQYILTESMPPQHEALADIAKAAGYCLEQTDDFIQIFRR